MQPRMLESIQLALKGGCFLSIDHVLHVLVPFLVELVFSHSFPVDSLQLLHLSHIQFVGCVDRFGGTGRLGWLGASFVFFVRDRHFLYRMF